MGDILTLFPGGVPVQEPRPLVDGTVKNFRGTSRHRDRGCTGGGEISPLTGDCTCPKCAWGAMICAVCGGAEGELPTDCPRTMMTQDQADEVMQGSADYIVSLGGWLVGRYVAGRFKCDGE